MRGIKIPQQDLLSTKNAGGGLCTRGAYLRDTKVLLISVYLGVTQYFSLTLLLLISL